MLETLLIKNLDKYPENLKILEYSKTPYYEYPKLKYYGFGVITHNISLLVFVKDFKEILRNR